jgi:hypothetical protein
MANFYFQVVEGCVRMFNSNYEGKEFTQGYFVKGKVLENHLFLLTKNILQLQLPFKIAK